MSVRPYYDSRLVAMPVLTAWHQAAPYPKDRPRITTAGGRPRMYQPTACTKAERALAATLTDAWRKPPTTERVILEAVFVVPPPRAGGKLPDVDNLLKLVMDAANRLLYADDSQVEEVCARRRCRPVAESGTLIIMGMA